MRASLILGLALAALASAVNAAQPEILPSGAYITHLRQGQGAVPTVSSTVTVNYRGTLMNGVEFDSSYRRGQPATFSLGRVIPCWTEGLQYMRAGGKVVLDCPANTAYGERGVPPFIAPNTPLRFEVELLDVR